MYEKVLRLTDTETEKVVVWRQSCLALEQLEEPCPPIADVADEVGYADAFRVMFFQILDGLLHELGANGNRRTGKRHDRVVEDRAAEYAHKTLLGRRGRGGVRAEKLRQALDGDELRGRKLEREASFREEFPHKPVVVGRGEHREAPVRLHLPEQMEAETLAGRVHVVEQGVAGTGGDDESP